LKLLTLAPPGIQEWEAALQPRAAARAHNSARFSSFSSFADLRTNDTEERIKRENNFETLRRLAHVNAVAAGGPGGGGLTERESQQLATIQKMDILRQAAKVGGYFFWGGGGGFGAPLTAPLGIPASDLARIAQTVPDPAAASGEPTSGTGTTSSPPLPFLF